MRINLPEYTHQKIKDVLLNVYSERPSLGFIVNSMAINEIGLCLADSINKYIEKQDIEIAIFTILNEPITLVPMASIYKINNINTFFGKPIATDINTWIYLKNLRCDKKYFYIYDPIKFQFVSPKLLDEIRNSNTVFFTRSKVFSKYLKNNYKINCEELEVPNFEIPLIRKIINE